MQPEITSAIIGGVATIVAAIIGGWVAIRIKQLELKPTGTQSSNNRLWGIIGALILGGIVFISLTAFGYFSSIFQPSKANGTAITNSGILLSDSFDNPTYDGEFNTDLWNRPGSQFGDSSATQTDGSMRLEGVNRSSGGGLQSQLSWSPNELSYVQGKVKLQPTDSGGIVLILRTGIKSGGWETSCWIQRYSASQAEYACDLYTYNLNSQRKDEYMTESFPVKYDEWHTAKIELIPNTFELRFYMDGKLIGQHIPLDKDELKLDFFHVSFGVYTDTHLIGYVDDIVVKQAP